MSIFLAYISVIFCLLTIITFLIAIGTFTNDLLTNKAKRKALSNELPPMFIFGAIFVISTLSYYLIYP